MKFLIAVLFCVLISGFAHGEGEDTSAWPKVNMPAGSLPAGATIEVKTDKAGEAAFAADSTGQRAFKSTDSGNYATVTSLTLKNASMNEADQANFQSDVKSGSMKISTAQLKASATCTSSGDVQGCVLKDEVSVMRPSAYNPTAFAQAATSVSGSQPKSATASSASTAAATMVAINKPLSNFKSTNGGIGAALANCPIFDSTNSGSARDSSTGSAFSFDSTGGPPACALRQAQNAFTENKGKSVKQDVMIINDFSSGGVTGKMWFVNSNGTLANVGVPNPIQVSRGDGGFGAGAGSHKTPNGAIVTASYNPPRGGNIKDGIDLIGLEPGNRDISSRGVLLHGWNPAGATSGCLGVCGDFKSAATGNYSALGGANYLDTLKSGLLKPGGVLIYNFTPDKSKACN